MIVLLLVGGFLGILTVFSLPVTVLWCFWVGSLGTYLILFAFVKTIQPGEVKLEIERDNSWPRCAGCNPPLGIVIFYYRHHLDPSSNKS